MARIGSLLPTAGLMVGLNLQEMGRTLRHVAVLGNTRPVLGTHSIEKQAPKAVHTYLGDQEMGAATLPVETGADGEFSVLGMESQFGLHRLDLHRVPVAPVDDLLDDLPLGVGKIRYLTHEGCRVDEVDLIRRR
jgi:hypothetical protein